MGILTSGALGGVNVATEQVDVRTEGQLGDGKGDAVAAFDGNNTLACGEGK